MRYFDKTDLLEPRPTICMGNDGKRYAVFRDEFSRMDYDRMWPGQYVGCAVACFNGYANAYELGPE